MSIQRPIARRRILAAAAFAGAGGAAGLAVPRLVFAQGKRTIKFTLAWVAEGSTLFTFVAKGMGFWEKHGLDVDIARGSGSVAAAQATDVRSMRPENERGNEYAGDEDRGFRISIPGQDRYGQNRCREQ